MSELHDPFTVKDLEKVTGLQEQAVKRAIIAGQLPGAKVGGRYVIPHDAFVAFCEGHWTAREWRAPDPIRPIPEMIKRRAS